MYKLQNSEISHPTQGSGPAFTLIELLIVVAIIAILAVIALPNFMEAQVRSKVSRAKSDMRAISVGLEMYAVDNNDYPPDDGNFNIPPVEITTPIAYLTDSKLIDPFAEKEFDRFHGHLVRYYSYFRIIGHDEFEEMKRQYVEAWERYGKPPESFRFPAIESIDSLTPPGQFNPGALERYGLWRLASNGPDRRYVDEPSTTVLQRFDITYDPTNGTISVGNIFRTQKQREIQR